MKQKMKEKRDEDCPAGIRLQKYMADCGVASRRKCEELITSGRVRVNGKVVSEMGTRVVAGVDKVTLDGAPVSRHTDKHVYYMLNKPRGYIVSASDPQGRRTIYSLLSGINERVVPVGRLDLDSEGLLLLTNDGELTFRLMHPRYGIEKEYQVWATGEISDASIAKLRSGVVIEGKRTQPAQIDVASRRDGETHAYVVIREGKKRQVRVMFEAVGHRVTRLVRFREGSLSLGKLPAGKYRELTPREVASLKREVGLG